MTEDEECDCTERAPPDEYWICPKCDAELFPLDEDTLEQMDMYATQDAEDTP